MAELDRKNGKGKHIMKVFAVIAVLVIIVCVARSFRLAAMVMTGNRQTLEEAMKWQSDRYDTSFYRHLEKNEYTVEGDGGYILHAVLLKNPEPTDRYVIISHGYTDNRNGSLKYARIYLDLGFNCIIYDLRGHGLNENTFTTYGILEAKDLIKLIEETRARYPGLTVLGLHGESLGAATTVTCLKYSPKVDFAVSDCGFSDIENVLRPGYRNAGVPQVMFDLTSIGARLRYGYSLKEMRPVDSLDSNTVPILFIHGSADPFILPSNSVTMYERDPGPKEIRYIEGAEHAESVLKDYDRYSEYLYGFLKDTAKVI